MITFLRINLACLLVLTATTSSLMATAVNFGDGFTLMTTDSLNYFTVSPGQANAGMTSTEQSQTDNIFQLLAADGTNPGGAITYGQLMSVQLPANKLWVTLNPASPFGLSMISLPYVRNNAPQPLEWETLYFVPVDGNLGDPISYGQQVYLATLGPDRSNDVSYLSLDTTNQTATTVLTVFDLDTPTIPYDATPFIIQSASFSPYTQTSTGAPINYGDQFTLQYGSYNFNVQPTSVNAGYIALEGWPSHYEMLSVNGGSGQAVYGAPIYLGASGFAVTLNPAPGNIRNNLMNTGSVWEKLYFIPVHGRNDLNQQVNIRNGDLMYSGDKVYLARNGLISGEFRTEYVAIDSDTLTASTTFDFASASLLTLSAAG